jgi:hypothetical protein
MRPPYNPVQLGALKRPMWPSALREAIAVVARTTLTLVQPVLRLVVDKVRCEQLAYFPISEKPDSGD